MTNQNQIVVFSLDEPRYALPLDTVEHVVHVVDITPLPKAPLFILGVINVQGEIIPVVDIRQRLRLPGRAIQLQDQLILARTPRRRMALLVDAVSGVITLADKALVSAEQVMPGVAYIHGLAKLDGSLVLICDLDQFISAEEAQILASALEGDERTQSRKPRGKTSEAVLGPRTV